MVKQPTEQESLAKQVSRPLFLGMTGLNSLLIILLAWACYPPAQRAGMTGWLILGVLLLFALCENTVFFLLRHISRTYLYPLSEASEIAALAAAGDLTRSTSRIPPTSRETEILLQAVNEMGTHSSSCLLKLEQMLTKLADGDLTIQVDCPQVSECNGVCCAAEETAQKLRGSVGAVRTALEQLFGPLDSLEQNALGLAGQQENGSGNELLRALTSLTAQLRQRADSAANVSSSADILRQKLVRFDLQQRELEQAVERINECACEAGKFVKDMETASFQCSVLARTAYVEAAGAGVNGKGIAIVASELRILASRSAQAAQDASAFVSEMRQTIREGAGLAAEVSKELQNISAAGSDVCQKAAYAAQEAVQAKDLQEAVRQANRLDAWYAESQKHAGRMVQSVQSLKSRINKLRAALQAFRLT